MQKLQSIEQNIYRLVTENQQSLFQKISNPETMNRILMETNGNVPSKVEILSAIAQNLMFDENFIRENYKILTNVNASSEELRFIEQQLDESIWERLIRNLPKLPGWVWDAVKGWIWKGPGKTPTIPPTPPTPTIRPTVRPGPPIRPRTPRQPPGHYHEIEPESSPGEIGFEAFPSDSDPVPGGWGPWDWRKAYPDGVIIPGVNEPLDPLDESYFYLKNFNTRLLELNNNIKTINESRQSTNLNQNYVAYLMGLRSEIQRSNELLEYIINGIHVNNINNRL